MHLEQYVESLNPFSSLKLFIPFINPIVPIDIYSSLSIELVAYFLAICATNLKLCSISLSLASFDPAKYSLSNASTSFALKA